MIVAFENNVVCSDEKVRDYLLAHHADLKEDQDEDALCLVRFGIRRKTLMALIVWT